jgi:hypothetical protein
MASEGTSPSQSYTDDRAVWWYSSRIVVRLSESQITLSEFRGTVGGVAALEHLTPTLRCAKSLLTPGRQLRIGARMLFGDSLSEQPWAGRPIDFSLCGQLCLPLNPVYSPIGRPERANAHNAGTSVASYDIAVPRWMR